MGMEPLFDRDRALRAWLKDRTSIFGLDMEWIAFVKNGNAFTAADLVWLGPLKGDSLLDRRGRPVLWIPGAEVQSALHPLAPLRPVKPIRPVRPIHPIRPLTPGQPLVPPGGWSGLGFAAWMQP